MFPYISKSIHNILTISKIINCFHLTISPGNIPSAEQHDFWEVVYIEEGNGEAIADDKRIPLVKGDIIFHKPNELHDVCNTGKSNMRAHFISFECKSKIMQLFENKIIKSDYDIKSTMASMFDMAEKTFETRYKNGYVFIKVKNTAPTGGMQQYKLYLEQMLLKIINKIEEETDYPSYSSKEEFEQKLYENIKTIIEESLYDSFSVELLCKKLNYSRSYITKLFKRFSGISVSRYYTSLKISEAKKLLRKKEYTISDISEILCYNTPYYFSYAFKTATGMSPNEYRKDKSAVSPF